MCGIFGFWIKRKLDQKDILFGKKLTAGLRHRGPDGINYFWDKNKGLFLGHTRLAIIDLSTEAGQPMTKHNMVISFNGEIYNYLEIRNFLEKKGYQFITKSDTEVILSSFDFWGIEAVRRFDGMFAISLFMQNKLYLITDNFLEKPIYCFDNNDGVYFSSEPQILIDNMNIDKSSGLSLSRVSLSKRFLAIARDIPVC